MPPTDPDNRLNSNKMLREHDFFNASYNRCINLHDEDVRFINYFYGVLKSRDHNIAQIFEAYPVHHQVHALRTSLYLLIDFHDNKAPSAEFTDLINSHTGVRLGLQPYMSDIWLDCLLETVAEHDPLYCEETKAAWIAKIKPGTDFLKSVLEKALSLTQS